MRLLFTLGFVVLILPKIVSWYWQTGVVDEKEKLEAYDTQLSDIREDAKEHSRSLLTSLDQISIEDPKLRSCIVENLDRYRGVTNGSGYNVATDLNILHCDRRGITSISGLEHFENLKDVSFRDNNIGRLDAASQLEYLEVIDLSGNSNLENIELLVHVDKLKKLSIGDQNTAFCYEIEKVISHIRENIPANAVKPVGNFKNMRCRGKSTDLVKKLVLRKQKGEELTHEEIELVTDYEHNETLRY